MYKIVKLSQVTLTPIPACPPFPPLAHMVSVDGMEEFEVLNNYVERVQKRNPDLVALVIRDHGESKILSVPTDAEKRDKFMQHLKNNY